MLANVLAEEKLVTVHAGGVRLEGMLGMPERARGVILFSHGSGSSRLSPRNNFVARALRQAGLGTLLVDLLTEAEDAFYENRFDIDLLSERLLAAVAWLVSCSETQGLPIGLFGASTGAASALRVAAALGPKIGAVVSRGGRPDLAGGDLPRVTAPTLLVVGENDDTVRKLNQDALQKMRTTGELVIVPRATHLFEEPGTLEEVARLAARWFTRYLHPES
jgi:putative phosphoribosyl transferase